MDPLTASVIVGGGFLSKAMEAKAAEEAQRKKTMAELILKSGSDQQAALQNLMSLYQGILGK